MTDYRDATNIDPNLKYQIDQIPKFIREKMYGVDVREAIAQGIERTYEDASKNGNANMEVSAARGSYPVLKDRLDAEEQKVTAQLAQTKSDVTNILNQQIVLESDVDATFKKGHKLDSSFLKDKHTLNYAMYRKKVSNKEPITSTHQGDSLTYGWDTVSANKRPAITGTTSNGETYPTSHTRAAISYPEALQEYLQPILGSGFKAKNRGYSGDYAKESYDHWNVKHDGDINFIMLGTNDATHTTIPEEFYRHLDTYLYWMEQVVIREILWGKAVVLLTPPKMQNTGSDSNKYVDIYRNALFKLGSKYNINVVDTELFFANQPSTIYSDPTHFNDKGYRLLGAKVASLVLSESLDNPIKVYNGTKLLTRSTIDGAVYFGDAYFDSISGGDTPEEVNTITNISGRINTNGGVIYTIYNEVEDVMIFPLLYSTSTVRIEIDFNTVVPVPSLDTAQFKDYSNNSNLTEISPGDFLNNGTYDIEKTNLIALKTKGWHTIKITNVGNVNNIVLQAVEFLNEMPGKITQRKNKGNDLNNILSGGISFEQGAVNTPAGFLNGWLTVNPYQDNTHSLQTYVDLDGKIAMRTRKNGVWGVWKTITTTPV